MGQRAWEKQTLVTRTREAVVQTILLPPPERWTPWELPKRTSSRNSLWQPYKHTESESSALQQHLISNGTSAEIDTA